MATRIIPPYATFTDFTPVIPKLYWDVESAEQRYHALCKELGKLIAYVDTFGNDINANTEQIEALAKEFLTFKESGFYDYYAEQISQWIAANMPEIMRESITQVYFGLTLDGYFVAYVPESWDDIIFDTGAVYGNEEYGRLILRYDVDSPHVVEQP